MIQQGEEVPEGVCSFLALEAAWLKHRIRERAYEIWAASGRSGETEQHWLAAEREILSASADFSPTVTREAEDEILKEMRRSLGELKSGEPNT